MAPHKGWFCPKLPGKKVTNVLRQVYYVCDIGVLVREALLDEVDGTCDAQQQPQPWRGSRALQLNRVANRLEQPGRGRRY